MAASMFSNVKLTLKETVPVTKVTGDTFYIFETGIVATEASIVFSNKSNLERFVLDIATDGECTIVKRWLDNTTTKTEDSDLNVEWGAGTEWYITVLASDLLDIDSSEPVIITSPRTFTWAVIYTSTLTISSTWGLIVNWTSTPFPIVADDAARDVLYPTPAMGNMCINWWDIQKYNSITAQRETLDVWTPIPNATELVRGKARLATDAEAVAGADDETIMTPKKVKSARIDNSWALIDKTYYAWEDLDQWETVFIESTWSFVVWSNSTDAHAQAWSSQTASITDAWVVITPNSDLLLTVVNTAFNSTNGETLHIYSVTDWAVIASSVVVSQIATFSPVSLIAWQTYRIYCDSTTYYWVTNAIPAYPLVVGNITYTGWWSGGSSNSKLFQISSIVTKTTTLLIKKIWDVSANTRVSTPIIGSGDAASTLNVALAKTGSPSVDLWIRIETDNAWSPSWTLADVNAESTITAWSLATTLAEETLTLLGSITLTKWVKYHVVFFQWTYWSETVNSSNYYRMWYSTNNTTTRWTKLYDWSSYSSVDTDKWIHVVSDLFEANLISLTDASYDYKVDMLWVVNEDAIIWVRPDVITGGIAQYQSWMSIHDTMYLSNTAGAISSTTWTNKTIAWKAISDTTIMLGKKVTWMDITITSSPMTWINTTGGAVQIKITGGTVNPIVVDWITVATSTNKLSTVPAWKSIVITYSNPPTISYSEL